jgi:hypothetical protein
MLFSSLLDNQFCKSSTKNPLLVFTYGCPCRVAWIDETQEWLEGVGLGWRSAEPYFPSVEFNDTDTLLMFKLAFAGTLSQKCRH